MSREILYHTPKHLAVIRLGDTVQSHQSAWANWLLAAFPNDPVIRPHVRIARFLEEANELAQAMNVSREDAHKMVDFVFDRPVGEPHQELAGCFATLCVTAEALQLDLGTESEKELESAYRRIPEIREKSKLKPKVVQ